MYGDTLLSRGTLLQRSEVGALLRIVDLYWQVNHTSDSMRDYKHWNVSQLAKYRHFTNYVPGCPSRLAFFGKIFGKLYHNKAERTLRLPKRYFPIQPQ